MMTNKFTLLSTVLFILLLIIFIENYRVQSLKIEISNLKIESKQAIDRAEKARVISIEEMEDSQVDSQQILLEKVSSNCKEAMKWGIKQAKTFKS